MKRLLQALADLGVKPGEGMTDKFELYMQLVLEWNEHVNLTAIRDRDEFIEKHFIDSLCCAGDERYIKAQSVVDVGTGAGFPGLPLAIISPEKDFLLIDSLKKRVRILDEIIEKLGLENVKTLHGRAEDIAHADEYRQQFDVSVSRAVSRLSVLSEYCMPFVRKGGWMIAYKGPGAEEEAAGAQNAVRILGGKIEEIKDAEMEKYGLSHKIVFIKKTAPTPPKYPRKAGVPEKQPL